VVMKTRFSAAVLAALLLLAASNAGAAVTASVDLGGAAPYAVLSGASIANTVSAPGAQHTTIRGDLGIKADTAPSGFPPGVVTGTIRHGSSVDPAHADAVSAYDAIAARPGGVVIPGALVGVVLSPGLYTIAGAASNTGTLTLNGGGDPNAVFVFQVDGALSFAAASHVVLANGAQASRVFWQVNGAGAIGAGADFVGTMIAKGAVAMGNGTFVNGRAIALTGALTLDNNQFYGAPPVVTIDGGSAGYTTNTTPTIFGTTDLESPGQVTVTIAGQTLLATPVNGNWSVTSGLLANGTYLVEASGTDAAGNPSRASQQLTVDTVPPAITISGGAAVAISSSTPTIGGTSDVSIGTVVRVVVGAQDLNALVQGDHGWNIRAANLADGTYQATASVTDPAGNESVATQSITIDTTPPAVTVSITPKKVRSSGQSQSSLGKLGPTILLNLTETATIRFQITRSSFKTKTFQISGDRGASFVRIPKPILKSLSLGSYKVTVTATDAAGQASTPKLVSFKVIL